MHGTSAAYAAHRKAGEKPCDECRAWANAASKASREKRKADRAAVTGEPLEPKAKKATSLRDYADALRSRPLTVYTHQVCLPDGSTFSIHKSEEAAIARAATLKNATVAPFTPNPTTYWTTGEQRYDH